MRIDAPKVIRDGIRAGAPGETVTLARDATYRPDETVHVVQASSVKLGDLPAPRLAFLVDVTVSTTAPSEGVALTAAETVGDAILGLISVGDVLVSSPRCVSEPAGVGVHSPSGAASVVARYQLILRRK